MACPPPTQLQHSALPQHPLHTQQGRDVRHLHPAMTQAQPQYLAQPQHYQQHGQQIACPPQHQPQQGHQGFGGNAMAPHYTRAPAAGVAAQYQYQHPPAHHYQGPAHTAQPQHQQQHIPYGPCSSRSKHKQVAKAARAPHMTKAANYGGVSRVPRRTRADQRPKDKQSPWENDVEIKDEVDLDSDDDWKTDTKDSKGPKDKQSPWGDDTKSEEEPEISDENPDEEWDGHPKDETQDEDSRGEWDPTKDETWDGDTIATVEQDNQIIQIENVICAVKDTQMIQALQLPCYVEECKMKLKKIGEVVCKSKIQTLIDALQINCSGIIQQGLTPQQIKCIMNRFIAELYDVTGTVVKTYTELSNILVDSGAACLSGLKMDPLPIIDPSDPSKPNITADLIPYLTSCSLFIENSTTVTTWKEIITIISNCVLNSVGNTNPTNPKVSPAQLACIVKCFSDSLFDPKDPINNYKNASDVLARCGAECVQLPVSPIPPYNPNDPTLPLLTPDQVKCLSNCAKTKYMSDSTTIHDWSGVVAAFTKCIAECISGGGSTTIVVTQTQLQCIVDHFMANLVDPTASITNYSGVSTALVTAGEYCLKVKVPPLPPIDPSNPTKPDISSQMIDCLAKCAFPLKNSTSITTWDGVLSNVKNCVTSCTGTTPTPASQKVTQVEIQKIIDMFIAYMSSKTEYAVTNFQDISKYLVSSGETILKVNVGPMPPINPSDPTYPLVNDQMRDCIARAAFQYRQSTTISDWNGILSAISQCVTSCVGASPAKDGYPTLSADQLTCVVDVFLKGIQQWIPHSVPVAMKTMAWKPGRTMNDPTELDQDDGPPDPHRPPDALSNPTPIKNFKDVSDLVVKSGTQCTNVTVAAPQLIDPTDPTKPGVTAMMLQGLIDYKTTLADSTKIKDWTTFLAIFNQCFINVTKIKVLPPSSPKVGTNTWRDIITQYMAESSDPSKPVTNYKGASEAFVTAGQNSLRVVLAAPKPIYPSDPAKPDLDSNQMGCLTNAFITEMNNCSSPPAGWSAPADWNTALNKFIKFVKTCTNIPLSQSEQLLEDTPPDFDVRGRTPGRTQGSNKPTPLDGAGLQCFTECLTQRIKDPSIPIKTYDELCVIYSQCSNNCVKDERGMTPTGGALPCMADCVKDCAKAVTNYNVPVSPPAHSPGKTQALVNRYNDLESDAHTECKSGYDQIDHLKKGRDALGKRR